VVFIPEGTRGGTLSVHAPRDVRRYAEPVQQDDVNAGGDAGEAGGDGPSDTRTGRLDAAVGRVAGVSVGRARRLLAGGGVEVNGQTARAGDKGRRVTAADRVVVRTDVERVVPEPGRPLVELGRGPGWVAVEKPAGVPVHPLAGGETGTLLNAAVARYAELAAGVGREGPLRSGVVHRLDVDTSGVVVLALTNEAWDRLRDAFAQHRVVKTYHALVRGDHPDSLPAEGRADLHLAVTRHRPARVSVVGPDHPGARSTAMSWRTVERRGGVARIDVALETGFLHQIRVACAHRGFPVLGDRTYGRGVAELAPRQMLHAAAIAVDGVHVVCPEPAEMRATWARLRQR